MSSQKDQHLNDDQLVRAVVDLSDLNDDQIYHLKTCRMCQSQVKKLELPLSDMGRLAQSLAPKPKHAFRLSQHQKARIPITLNWNLKSALGLAVAALLIIVVIWMPKTKKQIQGIDPGGTSKELAEIAEFMNEIDQLVENALPETYQELTRIVEHSEENNFMDFVVPDVEDPALGVLSEEKGVLV